MKLELILRLLDNDELSPEQVNDVRDFLEDYVDRNQVCTASYSSLFLFHCCCKQWNLMIDTLLTASASNVFYIIFSI